MADSVATESDEPTSRTTTVLEVSIPSDDDQDVHFCGRCKLSFNDLSEYIKHKANKVCRDIVNKSSLTEVVNKLPIDAGSHSHSGETNSREEVALADTTQHAQECVEGTEDDCAAKKVEVQFLDPVATSDGASSSAGEKPDGHKTSDHEKTEKPTKRHKRKNSHPKTTRKRKCSSTSTASSTQEKSKEPRTKKPSTSDEPVTVHIPESQLVHLNPCSTSTSATSPQRTGVRKQGATSVFVPIYLNPPSKIYRCQRCPAVFNALKEKEEHCKMHKKEFKCSLCNKSFFTANGFEQHRLNESHVHPCDECGKVFTSTIQLKKHKTTHSTERPFACDECAKAFCSSANLRSHKRTVHATEKKHKCPECGKAFARKDKMKRHSLIHYPDTRPTFTCPFRSHTGCMKTFYREDKLKRHLFTHSKDKPFKCEQCNKGYARRDNLNDHMRIHTGNYSHICQLCDKGFLGPHKLKKHLKSAHRDVYSADGVCNALEYQSPTMVPLNSGRAPTSRRGDHATPTSRGNVAQSSSHEETAPSSPEDYSVDADDDVFDELGSETGDEPTSEDERTANDDESLKKSGLGSDPRHAPPRAPPPTVGPPPLTSSSHGPLPRVRPVPRVSATPQQFVAPPIPPGLQATAELMAFTQELFNAVGRFQS